MGEDSGTQLVNADAERTLLRIKQKLEGVEGGMVAPSGTCSILESFQACLFVAERCCSVQS